MSEKKNNTENIPNDHPRAESLKVRHNIIDGLKNLIVTEAGLIAHGRGEAFDYLIGEKTNENAIVAMEAAVTAILTAEHPVISVNGNIAALCAKDLVKLSEVTGAQLEINIFYRKLGRIEAITKALEKEGAKNILGIDPSKQSTIEDLKSNRRNVDSGGIKIADVVIVPLEDGDRTEALILENKFVIAIDLNPLSRTAQYANITIVDNVLRAIPKMVEIAEDLKRNLTADSLKQMEEKVKSFSNKRNLSRSIEIILKYLQKLSKLGIFIKN
jgi:4-phosphopantoate--beta-alanine ligase